MKIEYLAGTQPHVEHVSTGEIHQWTTEHPQAVILHATPDQGADDATTAAPDG